jgi:hypothetical protein
MVDVELRVFEYSFTVNIILEAASEEEARIAAEEKVLSNMGAIAKTCDKIDYGE